MFCINWFGIGPLQYHSSRSDFGFEFVEIFVFENDSPLSTIQGVGYWIFKKKTLRIGDTESRRLPESVIRWVADSPYPSVGEPATLHITDTESWRLHVSLSQGVVIW